MGYFEYRDLAPIDNIENGDKYIEALNWAFQNKKVKNIALTGPYGAGKSSVIETFLAQDDKKNNKLWRNPPPAVSRGKRKRRRTQYITGVCIGCFSVCFGYARFAKYI